MQLKITIEVQENNYYCYNNSLGPQSFVEILSSETNI